MVRPPAFFPRKRAESVTAKITKLTKEASRFSW
jgi:hypothetical protein